MSSDIPEIKVSAGFYQEARQAAAAGPPSEAELQKLHHLAAVDASPDEEKLAVYLEDRHHLTAFQQAGAGHDFPVSVDIPEAGGPALHVQVDTPYEHQLDQLSEQLACHPDDMAIRQQLKDAVRHLVLDLQQKAGAGLPGYQQAKLQASHCNEKMADLRARLQESISKGRAAGRADHTPLNEEQRRLVALLWAYAQTRPDLLAQVRQFRGDAGPLPATGRDAGFLATAFVARPGIRDTILNSTAEISQATPPANVRAALGRTIGLIEQVRPDVAAYLRNKLADKDFVLGGPSESGRQAAWMALGQHMVLYDDFFKLNDDEKASVLIHETNHATAQLNLRRHLSKLGHTLGLPGKKNSMEYPAFLQQVAAMKALGISEQDSVYGVVKEGFEAETGYQWPPARDNVELFRKIDKEALLYSSADVFAANRALARASTMQERAAMIRALLEQTPTSGDQAQLAYDILADGSREPDFRLLVERLDREQLHKKLAAGQHAQISTWFNGER